VWIHVLFFLGLKQISMDVKMRADAFAAFGALSKYGVGAQREIFLEQVPYVNWL